MENNSGWYCPNCGGAHAPSVESCPLYPTRPVPLPLPPIPLPVPPLLPPNVGCAACRDSGVCMCYRRDRVVWC